MRTRLNLVKIYYLRAVFFCLIVGLIFCGGNSAYAQQKYPTRGIDLVVAFTAGGGPDTVARLIAPFVSKKWNVPVSVINKPGGSGVVGTNFVMTSKPDGYTITLVIGENTSLLLAAIKDLPYDIKNITYIAQLVGFPQVYVVKADSPWKNLKDVSEAVKKNPANFIWGCGGASNTGNLAVLQFIDAIGVDPASTKRVIYAGNPAAAIALAGGDIHFFAASTAAARPLTQVGKIRPVAIGLPKRLETMLDVPTAQEQGFPQLTAYAWGGIAGPPGIPEEVVRKWDEALREFIGDADFLNKAETLGIVPTYLTSEKFREHALTQAEEATRLFKKFHQ